MVLVATASTTSSLHNHPRATIAERQHTEADATMEQPPLCLSCLSDDLLVHIGKRVATLCGARDYIALSRTCQRFHNLLTQPQTIEDVFEMANQEISALRKNSDNSYIQRNSEQNYSERNSKTRLYKNPSLPYHYSMSLEILALCDSLREHGIFSSNRLIFDKPFEPRQFYETNSKLLGAIQTILQTNPNATVLLDGHCGDCDLEGYDLVTDNYAASYARLACEHILHHDHYARQNNTTKQNQPTLRQNHYQHRRGVIIRGNSASTTAAMTDAASTNVSVDRIRMRFWGDRVVARLREEQANNRQSRFVGCRDNNNNNPQIQEYHRKSWVEVYFRILPEGDTSRSSISEEDQLLPRRGLFDRKRTRESSSTNSSATSSPSQDDKEQVIKVAATIPFAHELPFHDDEHFYRDDVPIPLEQHYRIFRSFNVHIALTEEIEASYLALSRFANRIQSTRATTPTPTVTRPRSGSGPY